MTALLASATALALAAWLASIPGQAEDGPLPEMEVSRKPVTCTDAAGIIYDRGTPGFERCISEMNQAAREKLNEEQAGKVEQHRGRSGREEASRAEESRRTKSRTPKGEASPSPLPTASMTPAQ